MPSFQAGDLCELALYYFYNFFGEISLISLLYYEYSYECIFTSKKYMYALNIAIQDVL